MTTMNKEKYRVFRQAYKNFSGMMFDDLAEVYGENEACQIIAENEKYYEDRIHRRGLEKEYKEFVHNVHVCGSVDMVGDMYNWE